MNVKSLIGMNVFAVDAGKNLGSVERLLFSPEKLRVEGFVVTPGAGLMDEPQPQQVLSIHRIKHIGHDAVTVESESMLETLADGQIPAGMVAFDQVEKEKVLTEGGEQMGEVSSIDFNETSYAIEYIEVGRGFLSGSSMITVDQIISVGEDVIVVKDSAMNQAGEEEIEENEGLE